MSFRNIKIELFTINMLWAIQQTVDFDDEYKTFSLSCQSFSCVIHRSFHIIRHYEYVIKICFKLRESIFILWSFRNLCLHSNILKYMRGMMLNAKLYSSFNILLPPTFPLILMMTKIGTKAKWLTKIINKFS